MSKKYSKILVTGGAGFIGSHIVDKLLSDGYEVTVFDNLSTGNKNNIPIQKTKNLKFIYGDIRDLESVKKALIDIDAVFHEAALVSVAISVKDPILNNSINLDGTLNVLKAATDQGVKRLVFASSAAVYGENPEPRKKEDLPASPLNPYGITKLAGEYYAKSFTKLYGLETVSLRYFNVYGPRQSFEIENAYGGVITLFLARLVQNLQPIIYGDGEQSRDFVYVKDIVQANILALDCNSASGESFNIGSGSNITVNKISEILRKKLKKQNIENIYEKPRLGDVKHGFADITKAEKILNYTPSHSLEEGLTELSDWKLQFDIA